MNESDVTLSTSKGEPISGPWTEPSSSPSARLTAEHIAGAVLFREILKPLARGLGPVGDVALGSVADALFLRDVR